MDWTSFLLLICYCSLPSYTSTTSTAVEWKRNPSSLSPSPEGTPVLHNERTSTVDKETQNTKTTTSATIILKRIKKNRRHYSLINNTQVKGNNTFHEISSVATEDSNYKNLSDEGIAVTRKTVGSSSIAKDVTSATVKPASETPLSITRAYFHNSEEATRADRPFYNTVTPSVVHLNDPPWFNGPNVRLEPNYEGPVPIPTNDDESDNPPSIHSQEQEFDWIAHKEEWGMAWEIHVYLSGSLFASLSVYSLFNLMRMKSFVHLLPRGYFVTLNFLTLIIGVSRAVYLLHDPYNSHKTYPPILSSLLYDLCEQCLSSAFATLFLALLKYTRVKFFHAKIQNANMLISLILFQLTYSVTSVVVLKTLNLHNITLAVYFAGRVMFVSWSIFLSVTYFIVFRKLHIGALRKQGEMMRITFTKLHIDGGELPNKLPKPTIAFAVKVTLVMAIVELILAGPKIYGIVFIMYGIQIYQPWLWWIYNFSCRIIEFIVALTISLIAALPIRHFEPGEFKCKCPIRFRFKSILSCWKSEKYDFEAHSHYYANPQGLRSNGITTATNVPRRWSHTNSLPTFRSLPTEDNSHILVRNLPPNRRRDYTGRAHTMMSYRRPLRAYSLSSNEGLDNSLQPPEVSRRPPSMLFKENGFIRFRTDADPPQQMEVSEEEEEADNDSLRANAGSSIQSLAEDDVVQNSLSPFFQACYRSRIKSKCSLATTDNSVDLSIEQLCQVASRQCLSNSAIDNQVRKYGSTCSSESAANSFDVTFFLHGTPLRPPEGFEGDVSSIEAHEAVLRSTSPFMFPTVWKTPGLPLNLNLEAEESTASNAVKDITPDSAVCLDLNLPPPTSHSLGDLTRPQKIVPLFQASSKAKRSSRSFLNKLKGSTFSLNAAINGYELLESEDSRHSPGPSETNKFRNKVQRSASDRRPGSVQEHRLFASLADMRDGGGSASYGHLYHVDSGLLGDYAVHESAQAADDSSNISLLLQVRKEGMQVSD